MSAKPKILTFAGSAREGSLNVRLAQYCANELRNFGADATFLDMREFQMPLYDGDLELREGLPENAKRLKQLMKDHHGFLVSSPEYNSSVTPLLKNAIDWISRPQEGEAPLVAFRGKAAALVSASPGVLGGIRGLVHLRSILGNIGVWVMPDQVALSKAHEGFDEDGKLVETVGKSRVDSLLENFSLAVKRLCL